MQLQSTNRMKYTTFLIVVSVVVSVTSSPSERVTNGDAAASGDFPHIVSVVIGGTSGHRCGGFIYNEEWIVTAASCVYGYLPSQLSVTVAQVSLINVDPDELVYPIFRVFLFDGYVYTSKLHDIALLQTATAITFNDNVNFINYDDAMETSSDVGLFAGWGATFEGGLASSRLRSITVSFGVGCEGYGADQYNANYMICAGNSLTDVGSPCTYDEGSPLVQDFGGEMRAVGIMSKNAGCGEDFSPTIYTRLEPYYPWLDKIAGPQPTRK